MRAARCRLPEAPSVAVIGAGGTGAVARYYRRYTAGDRRWWVVRAEIARGARCELTHESASRSLLPREIRRGDRAEIARRYRRAHSSEYFFDDFFFFRSYEIARRSR